MAASPQTANDLMVVFSNTISAGFDALNGAVNGVFGLMIALVVALTGIQWALSSNREVLAAGFSKVLLIGAFAYVINDWQGLSQTIWDGFIELGITAGGGSLSRADFLNPGAILQQGWEIVKALGETPAPINNPLDVAGNLTDALILGLAMIGIMLAFAVLALQIIVTLLEFKIVTLGGFVLLPFGIWSKSSFLAERPLGFVVSSGLKVLALAIVVSGARSVFDQLQPSANPDLYEALAILAASLLLAMLALFIPNLASALVTGGPALAAGSAAAGALAVGGAAAAAVAGVTGLGAAAARITGPSRAAAGASQGRPPNAPGSGPPRPSNDNPPRGPGPGFGGGGTPAGMGESAARWTPPGSGSPPSDAPRDEGVPPAPSAATAGEGEAARRDFHRALEAERRPAARPARSGRAAALQAFFVANAGRALLPGNETSGALAPQLKDEEP
ncbi:MAG: P-type conjugative transfer protein TrbL [Phenylobacterium sp.]|uniref:P-type conjugative transfer protein TrbL n=1 Tax=Phenylobacterium sp. TaxID=1871053 RepID=UPI0011F60D3D|nr:P-type conjugative transfer protein TrbL [Phenylobacterium sp.]TAJ68775.1 MAG: P-type conjugative transfer protein TrbL [Phenylobacterium sp.]